MTTQRCDNCRFGRDIGIGSDLLCVFEISQPVPFWMVVTGMPIRKTTQGAECAAWKERNDGGE